MRKLFERITVSTAAALIALLVVGVVVVRGAWSEPTGAPPLGNVAAPFNVGSAWQQKEYGPAQPGGSVGSVGLTDVWIESAQGWVSSLFGQGQGGQSNACNWSGYKCDCATSQVGVGGNSQGVSSGHIIAGLQCTGGSLSNFRIFRFIGQYGEDNPCPSQNAAHGNGVIQIPVACNLYTINGQ